MIEELNKILERSNHAGLGELFASSYRRHLRGHSREAKKIERSDLAGTRCRGSANG
jgi:hypothetical protein